MTEQCVFTVFRNVNKQTRLVWGKHKMYLNPSDSSINRIEKFANDKVTKRYIGGLGEQIIMTTYYS